MFKVTSAVDQVAAHLREELEQGRWTGSMPGRDQLADELGVHGTTVKRALEQLEREGILKSAGVGKARQIIKPSKSGLSMRVVLVLYEPEDVADPTIVEIQHQLHAAGHRLSIAPKALAELKHDPQRVRAMMEKNPAAAWIVVAGSLPVLEELSKLSTPTFALFGNMTNLKVAGTGADKTQAVRDCIDYFYEKGHRRIVMLNRSEQIKSGLNANGKAMFEELEKRNLPSGPYNLPEWENTPKGLNDCLTRLFEVTPPDVILVDDWILSFAIQNYISHQQGPAFRHAVCVCMDDHQCFKWCQPSVAHFSWDSTKVVRRVVGWANHVSHGKQDQDKKLIAAQFVPGGS